MDLKARYAKQFLALLPTGAIWGKDGALAVLADCLAAPFAALHRRALDLIEEADPRTCKESLPDFEREMGLPDKCLLKAGTPTMTERRDAVVQKRTGRGGLSAAYFISMAAGLGYSISIETFRPFICGLSRCGDPLTADDSRFVWRVTIHGPRTSYFRAGGSMAGERLGQIAAAEDLECRLRTLQPSHTDLLISYEA